MQILFVTDIHSRTAGLDALPAADLVLVGGDVTQFGSTADVQRGLAALAARYPRQLAVLGNCDPPAAEAALEAAGVALHRRAVRLGAVVVAGLSGSNRTPFHTPYEWDDAAMAADLDRLAVPAAPGGLMVVSHAPPLGSGADRLSQGLHAGSAAVAAWVRRLRPTMVLCGHIHEARGQFDVDGIPVINPGALRQGHYALITLGDEAPRVEMGCLD